MGIGERGARGVQRQVRGHLAGGRDMALADAGALHDPFVGGVDRTGEFVIAEDTAGQIAAAAEHNRTHYRHEATPLATRAVAFARRSRATDSPIFASNS